MGSNPATPTKKPPEKDFLRRGSKKREISYGEKYCSGCSAVRLARQLRELEVAGSNPVSPTKIKTFALKGKGFLLWAYDGYSSPKVRVQEKRIPLYQAGSLLFVHPIRDSSGSEAERRNPVFPTERRDTKIFLFSFPDSDMSHVTRQTNSDKKLPAEQLLFVYFPSRSYLTSREATQSRFLFLFSNGNSFIQRRMKIKSHSRTTFLRFVQGLLLSGKRRKATQSEASKNQSNLSFTGKFFYRRKLPL